MNAGGRRLHGRLLGDDARLNPISVPSDVQYSIALEETQDGRIVGKYVLDEKMIEPVAMEQAAAMAEGIKRLLLRTLRALKVLGRYGPWRFRMPPGRSTSGQPQADEALKEAAERVLAQNPRSRCCRLRTLQR